MQPADKKEGGKWKDGEKTVQKETKNSFKKFTVPPLSYIHSRDQ